MLARRHNLLLGLVVSSFLVEGKKDELASAFLIVPYILSSFLQRTFVLDVNTFRSLRGF